MSGQDTLLLKWRTLKGWSLKSEAALEAGRKYAATGRHSANGAMTQHDDADQKRALCDLIDAIDGTIQNDWTGDFMSKDEAKAYVLDEQA